MEELINKHLLRMKSLQSIYDKNTGQHNVLGILINELTEQLRQYNVVEQSEQLKCEHKGRRTATELVEYCEDCKKILFHP